MKALNFVKHTFKRWNSIQPFRHGAVIAYYSVFSLPAFVVILANVAGLVYSNQNIRERINTYITSSISPEAAEQVQTMYQQTEIGESWTGIIIGVATLLFGATGVFYHLQKSFNEIWEVREDENEGIISTILNRLLALGVVFCIATLILAFMLFQAVLKTIESWLEKEFSHMIVDLFQLANIFIPLLVMTLLFALMFKILPDVKSIWKAVFLGGFVTALLFELGKFLIGIYFENFNPASGYGVAGSLVLILLWMNYIGLILLFGASFTKQASIEFEWL